MIGVRKAEMAKPCSSCGRPARGRIFVNTAHAHVELHICDACAGDVASALKRVPKTADSAILHPHHEIGGVNG